VLDNIHIGKNTRQGVIFLKKVITYVWRRSGFYCVYIYSRERQDLSDFESFMTVSTYQSLSIAIINICYHHNHPHNHRHHYHPHPHHYHHHHHRHHIGWGGKCGNNEVTCDLSGFGPKGRVLYCIAVLYSIVEPIIYLLLLGGEGGGGGGGHASDLVLSGDIL